ncbi:N-acetyl-D-Glu racemase DgcA [Pseudorhodoplanes sp.]|uniref:N-acetyl-D-Glu racemase DgcA n=1 Tax=Pseudorhodoplanes sp. TaxID=1934341 RepID=UPI002CA455F0|nr:N-acetyl-D-Glu racemase DgcA [Pseudorhodoplanes sp.]HWV42580.1 N-acetyl-D-Glu racemase DgcA [Pseudorhodoplanes sp.]
MVNPAAPRLDIAIERWPIAGQFTISRGAKTEAIVVVAQLSQGGLRGRGECVPYPRYGESAEGVAETLRGIADRVAAGLSRTDLQREMPPGAARNALDCAFWDLEAKRSGKRVHELAGLPSPRPLTTAFTISLGTPDAMAEAARRASGRPLLKVKLGADGDPARIAAVRAAAPAAQLIVDANEGWAAETLGANLAACAAAGVTLIEQPLPAEADDALRDIPRPVPICADESAHDRASLAALVGKYDAVNIKLDKTGGLTEALAMDAEARRLGLFTMAGCMVATSLSMAPAMLVGQTARVVDLDGPLLLARDRADGLVYEGSLVHPSSPVLWG